MSKLYPHFCGTCGSQLILEKKSSIFVCISCGNAYDYDYFPEDSLIDEAEQSLRSGDFVSARMSYSYILYREPNNCLALRGHLLCDLEAKYVSNLIATEYSFSTVFSRKLTRMRILTIHCRQNNGPCLKPLQSPLYSP